MSITWPCFYDHELFGLVGFDVPMGEVVEAITYYTKDKSGYAFMIDKNGQNFFFLENLFRTSIEVSC